MKGVFGFLLVVVVAVALALLLGPNAATVTLFWPPYRVDLSLNLMLIGLLVLFLLCHAALRTLALLRSLPEQAQRWRQHQTERLVHAELLDGIAYQMAGRFVRAQSAARRVLDQLQTMGPEAFPHQKQVGVLAHWLAAESAHALGDAARRDAAMQEAVAGKTARQASDAREGMLLRAATWAVEAQDAESASRWLAELPQGAGRRIRTLRLRLKLARLTRDTHAAIDMVRLLTKHRAFSQNASRSLMRGLVLDALRGCHDHARLLQVWRGLDSSERHMPELALALLDQWQALAPEQGAADPEEAWPASQRTLEDVLRVVWAAYSSLADDQRRRALLRIEAALPGLDGAWLGQIEQAQARHPADAGLQYLAGQAFKQRQLWGKASALLQQATAGLHDAELLRRSWCSLAWLAEQRGDQNAAQAAWKKAALA